MDGKWRVGMDALWGDINGKVIHVFLAYADEVAQLMIEDDNGNRHLCPTSQCVKLKQTANCYRCGIVGLEQNMVYLLCKPCDDIVELQVSKSKKED